MYAYIPTFTQADHNIERKLLLYTDLLKSSRDFKVNINLTWQSKFFSLTLPYLPETLHLVLSTFSFFVSYVCVCLAL